MQNGAFIILDIIYIYFETPLWFTVRENIQISLEMSTRNAYIYVKLTKTRQVEFTFFNKINY